ncbi:MAG TPA: hypothetical protein VGP94_09495 [Tepidisphaeraceae bacterium]|nr:hypothetical protein [Tepidisphaeraceae bacterium]
MRRVWDKERILHTLRNLHREGKDLSYNRLAKKMQSLISAAAYHFGSYRKAVERAGIDYGEIARRPRWTKPLIIKLIKNAKRKDDDLHWSAVSHRRDDLGRAAFASLQDRLFGSWDRALHAAGLDADQISRYRKWDRNTIVAELKERYSDEEALNSGALQREDPGVHAAAVRHFGTYDSALKAAGFKPDRLRQRRKWTRQDVMRELKKFSSHNGGLRDADLRNDNPALYGAALRLFKNLATARKAVEK